MSSVRGVLVLLVLLVGLLGVVPAAAHAETLTVSRLGVGSGTGTGGGGGGGGGATGGTVTSSPAGITCGATCTKDFPHGTVVTLTATPTSTTVFTGWGGACSGTGTCEVTLDQARTVEATFLVARTLTVQAADGGTITSSPAGIDCPATCTTRVANGTSVTLTATPADGWRVKSFTGCASNPTPTTCGVSMSEDRTVAAAFEPIPAAETLTVSTSGSGTVSSAPAGIACGATCSVTFPHGQTVVLTATPAASQTFQGWGGSCAAVTGTTCEVTMDRARTVSATFAAPATTVEEPVRQQDPAGAAPSPPVTTNSDAGVVALPLPPAAAPAPLAISITGTTRSLRAARERGLRATVLLSAGARLSSTLTVDRKTARRLGLRGRVLGRATTTAPRAGSHAVKVTLPRSARRLTSLRATLTITAVDASGRTVNTTRSVRLAG